ncbi:YafY family protein [Streptomyces sp. NBC_01306]|uniref:helix-turn-helix transcriptional regulator n=1 Tax=Streptomyces sp. NBC_01306 TaxID=2903819 RepID=UPI00225B3D2E|nr:WYL domain-containing protein [Streptomyces sp. NBC_01306]MCX4727039.1 WYL domain-containing protein [Streptomyces sp. NBC_01306]
MRAARLIKMVLLLQSRPMMTAAELAQELAVSERTVTRDALALSEAGVPVYAERGRSGGYRLIGGYRTRLTGLARTEAEALFLSGLPGALREMGLDDAASAARLKVSAALLPALRDAPASAARRFHLDAPGWYQEPSTPELLAPLAGAVWADRRVSARYRRRDGSEVERVLEPYGLVLKAGVWYVCARADGGPRGISDARDAADSRDAAGSRDAPGSRHIPDPRGTPDPPDVPDPCDPADFRVYRIDRFSALTLHTHDEHGCFVRDEAFDLSAFWEQRAAGFARSLLRAEVVVRVSASGAESLPYAVDRAAANEALTAASAPDDLGRVTVALPVESLEVAYTQLLALGPEVEVLEPPELRARFAEALTAAARLYA